MIKSNLVSVVMPVYGCEHSLRELHARLTHVLGAISSQHEIIMVNDGSSDNAWQVIESLAREDARVKGINLSRNFGQHYAITAGLDFACGDWVVVMDCDLQDIPEEIPKLYRKALEGFDIVVGLRANRQDSLFRKTVSRLFYRVFDYFTGTGLDHRIGNFGIYSEKVIRSVSLLREQNRGFGLFALWVGFRRAEIEIQHAPRPHGKTTYTLRRMLAFALDLIVAHSNKLLRLTVTLGLFLSFASFLYAAWLVSRYLIWGISIPGWTSLIVSIYFTAGLIIGAIGILGIYVGKIFNEVKGRPLYIIQSTTFEMDSHDA
uniref:Dolichol-phosphate mannosyltransferase n=1 Tax=Candidatus Kentrum sp. FM TaxID=2126340 RepID=A0A450WBP3_9GAMM|nr:MAG: dolichol-phosphate mannosyltransferase [Candidatus Kentron sp. FM]VFJ70142.1 MAG: dolichol-phosphate mannosyltransferase [Candidatus Kentron sp. FM]VFK14473.1 MAG: dolichol-phosphate mannosyltransferase [Candidatus Kentron sp. FM]